MNLDLVACKALVLALGVQIKPKISDDQLSGVDAGTVRAWGVLYRHNVRNRLIEVAISTESIMQVHNPKGSKTKRMDTPNGKRRRFLRTLLMMEFASVMILGVARGAMEKPMIVTDGTQTMRVGLTLRPETIDDSGEMSADAAKIRALLRQKSFAELEGLARHWTESHERNPSGSWRAEAFLSGVTPDDAAKSDIDWEACKELHALWRARSKGASAWQVVAEANFWTSYGWLARGKGYADTVTPEGWRLFRERSKRAESLLVENWVTVRDIPAAHAVMGRLALALNYPRDRRDRLFHEAIARWADYNALYFSYAMYLTPRWHGEEGEMKAWAWAVTEGKPEDFRHEIYARIAWSLTSSHRLVMTETGMEWPKIKAGFEVLRAKWPNSGHILNRYARFAWQAKDREKARALLDLIGDAPVLSAWGKRETFEQFRLWVGPSREARPDNRRSIR